MSPLLKVKVKPRSRKSEVKWEKDELMASVAAVPENGKANKELLRLVADFFQVPQKEIRIKSGLRSSTKWIQIPDEIDPKRTQGGSYDRNQQ